MLDTVKERDHSVVDRVYILEWAYSNYDDYSFGRFGIFLTMEEAYAHLDEVRRIVKRDWGSPDTDVFVTTEKIGYYKTWTDEEALADIEAHAKAGDPALFWMLDKNGNFNYTIIDPMYVGQPIENRIRKKKGKFTYMVMHRTYNRQQRP